MTTMCSWALRRVACAMLCLIVCRAEDWPQFRGPRGDGTSLEDAIPEWRFQWKTPLPGPGHSSPIVWRDRIFLTAFEPNRSFWQALLGYRGYRGRLLVLCLDRATGKVRWEREVPAATIEKVSGVNQPASPTPVTDGVSVFACFGSHGLVAFDFEGNKLWELELGPYPNHMGSASSPILFGDRVLLNVETDGPDFLLAVDKQSGKEIWRVPKRVRQMGYSTPLIWNGKVVVAGHESVKAYDPADGRELWTVGGLSTYVVPTPVADGRFVFVTSSGPGGNVTMAISPEGQVAWRSSKGAAYVASPILAGGRLVAINNGGVASCLDAKSGDLLWQQRLPARGSYYSSPITIAGVLYVINEKGEVSVLRAGETFKLLRTYSLDARVLASPAVSDGTVFIRSTNSLFAFGH